ncbi:arylesterase [Chelativorans sp. Marseille-P2723]|uniref:arylesterase n=1 Tax=Chelativorans sp. Marseille-P2723 TaxID=2709133 RepID=UPI00156ED191|nr:arylesterase [Chelativorans sp. Marseille-P2723]
MAFKSFHKLSGFLLPLTKMSMPVAVALLLLSAAPGSAEPLRIVGFGNSLMAGYQLAPGEGFTERLEQALRDRGYNVSVANAGVSGDTTSGGLARLDWSVPDDTDLVILELGGNDMLRGLPPQTVEKNLEEMIQRLKERDVQILLIGMYAAPNLGTDYQEAFNAIYPRLAQKHDLPLVPFFLDGVVEDASMQLEDRIHPNAKGVEKMVENVLPALEPLVAGEKPNM